MSSGSHTYMPPAALCAMTCERRAAAPLPGKAKRYRRERKDWRQYSV